MPQLETAVPVRTTSPREEPQQAVDAEDSGRYPTPSLASLVSALTEPIVRRIGLKNLGAFLSRKDAIRDAVRRLPQRMQRVTNQARLATELVDDFQAGVYRDIAWRSIALLSGALVYAVSPADVIPDAIPGLGTLDDLLVTGLALKLVRRQLEDYCDFKGYDSAEYFG